MDKPENRRHNGFGVDLIGPPELLDKVFTVLNLGIGPAINDVRDPGFSVEDDGRAAQVLDKIIRCAEGSGTDITLNDAEASDVISLLTSRRYLSFIANRIGEAPYFNLPKD